MLGKNYTPLIYTINSLEVSLAGRPYRFLHRIAIHTGLTTRTLESGLANRKKQKAAQRLLYGARMKKKALALTLILGLTILVTQNYHAKVKAELTPQSTIVPPEVLIYSPQNNSVTSANSISLVFNVSAPEAANAIDSHLRYIYYQADWQTEKQYLYFQNLTNDEYFDSMEFNTTLSNIPEGTHTLQIVACGTVILTEAMFGFNYASETNASIIFAVNSMHPEPFPTTWVVAASILIVALVGAGLLVYFKKYRR